MKSKAHSVVLFDGYCNLCNGTVDFLIKYKNSNELKFASLQSEYAKQLLKDSAVNINSDSVILYSNTSFKLESEAALHLLSYLKWPFQVLQIFWIIPHGFRDQIYRWIARNRYKWFGKRDTCRIATPEEQDLFLG
jgi:predicted DCC family thiol-disulfide oxidoreductase YuxK